MVDVKSVAGVLAPLLLSVACGSGGAGGPAVAGPSTNADLRALTLSAGTLSPAFSSSTTTYGASVANGTASLTVTATAADSGATLTVDGSAVLSGQPSQSIPLRVGASAVSVIVTAADRSTTRTYSVSVARAGSGGTCGAHPNEPSGLTPRWPMNPMDTLPPEGSTDAYGYSVPPGQAPTISIVEDPTSPGCDSKVLRISYPTTLEGGNSPSRFGAGSDLSHGGPKTRLYTSVFVYIDPTWTNNGNTGTKFFFFRGDNDGLADSDNHLLLLTAWGPPYELEIMLQSGGAGHDSALPFIAENTYVPIGAWYHLELYLVANTPGVADGVAKVWIDGTLVLDEAHVPYFAANQRAYWSYLWVDPTYGGGFNHPPRQLYFQIDDWYTSVGP